MRKFSNILFLFVFLIAIFVFMVKFKVVQTLDDDENAIIRLYYDTLQSENE